MYRADDCRARQANVFSVRRVSAGAFSTRTASTVYRQARSDSMHNLFARIG